MDKVRDENLESEPLCPTPGEDGAKMPISKFRHQQKRHLYLVYILIAAYVPSIILYIWLAVSYLRLRNQSTELDLFPCATFSIEMQVFLLTSITALARSSAVRKDNRVFSLTVANSPFAGDPSPKLDQAWHDLLEGLLRLLRISW